MARYGLRDQDRLDGMSNYVIWRGKILSVLDEYGLKDHAEKVLIVPTDADPLKKYEENQERTKHLSIVGVKNHVIPHIAGKTTTNDMWVASDTMYHGGSVQRRMRLENQMRLFQMMKGEEIDPFLFRLQAIQDQLVGIGATSDEGLLVRTTLNAVLEYWETFV